MVHRAIPDAWSFASPQQLLDARLDAIDEALRRITRRRRRLGPTSAGRRISPVRRSSDCDITGRPLGAANAALTSPPCGPPVALAVSDHPCASTAATGMSPPSSRPVLLRAEALVLQTATGRSDPEVLRANRGWTEEAWDRHGRGPAGEGVGRRRRGR